MNNLNELAKAAYENAKAKGFYDKPVSTPERMALIHSELSEALEADRKDSYAGMEKGALVYLIQHEETAFKKAYETKIKGTFEEEMADVVIRIMDLAGYEDVHFNWQGGITGGYFHLFKDTPSRLASIHHFVSRALDAHTREDASMLWENLIFVIRGVCRICAEKGIDLELHVKAKMRYNSLRPRMHGGKKY